MTVRFCILLLSLLSLSLVTDVGVEGGAAPDLIEPTNYRSAVELVMPGTWAAIDG